MKTRFEDLFINHFKTVKDMAKEHIINPTSNSSELTNKFSELALNNAHSPLHCSILVTREKNILSKGIRFFLKSEWSHADWVIYVSGIGLCVVGAVMGGVRLRKFSYAYPESKWKDIQIYVPADPFTEEEKALLYNWILSKAVEKHYRYQYKNFIQWIRYLTIRLWVGKSSDDKFYCIELIKRGGYFVRKSLFKPPLEIAHMKDITENKQLMPMNRTTFEYYYDLKKDAV